MLLAKIHVTLKPGVLDPQGEAVGKGLRAMGYGGVAAVRVGKYLEIMLNLDDREGAGRQVEEMCRRLLANPVIEEYRYSLEDLAGVSTEGTLMRDATKASQR
ncbi:Phosphoribosylformylglycinamidine synthase subunit PurS [Moorella thermoacetica]|uniref:Phosphoribosylformylglycinamidine synthase subunit PurS n=1 Tax=Neomoorella thermoacetica TaxID=1525 RepID=A0AAC9HJH1_NEOTH|nr:phosphoribosylformylglycinamidine synthase subunit PurS [Moorella thermoacetica]AOQ25013.1 phosphoribosylformylglycinamidine synthase subunit PurS [Moorella thermoacetica]TYL15445.1 Phosphoribosylformylglycinamidine synthase subunit PurS [Moorella thermoacetica]